MFVCLFLFFKIQPSFLSARLYLNISILTPSLFCFFAFLKSPVHGLFIDLTEEQQEKQKGEVTLHAPEQSGSSLLIRENTPYSSLVLTHNSHTISQAFLPQLSQVLLPPTGPHHATAISYKINLMSLPTKPHDLSSNTQWSPSENFE